MCYICWGHEQGENKVRVSNEQIIEQAQVELSVYTSLHTQQRLTKGQSQTRKAGTFGILLSGFQSTHRQQSLAGVRNRISVFLFVVWWVTFPVTIDTHQRGIDWQTSSWRQPAALTGYCVCGRDGQLGQLFLKAPYKGCHFWHHLNEANCACCESIPKLLQWSKCDGVILSLNLTWRFWYLPCCV